MKTCSFVRVSRDSVVRVFKVRDSYRLRVFKCLEGCGWDIVTIEIETTTPCFVTEDERASADTVFA